MDNVTDLKQAEKNAEAQRLRCAGTAKASASPKEYDLWMHRARRWGIIRENFRCLVESYQDNER